MEFTLENGISQKRLFFTNNIGKFTQVSLKKKKHSDKNEQLSK